MSPKGVDCSNQREGTCHIAERQTASVLQILHMVAKSPLPKPDSEYQFYVDSEYVVYQEHETNRRSDRASSNGFYIVASTLSSSPREWKPWLIMPLAMYADDITGLMPWDAASIQGLLKKLFSKFGSDAALWLLYKESSSGNSNDPGT